jgi:hypothetical protein
LHFNTSGLELASGFLALLTFRRVPLLAIAEQCSSCHALAE